MVSTYQAASGKGHAAVVELEEQVRHAAAGKEHTPRVFPGVLAMNLLMDWKPGAHASTFGGNPVAIAAAMTTIDLLQTELIANSADVGAYLKQGLEKLATEHDCIGDVRGIGLMIGVEFVKDRASKQADAELRDRVEIESFNRGLILLGCGPNSIRWSPPLVLSRENVDVALEIFGDAIRTSR